MRRRTLAACLAPLALVALATVARADVIGAVPTCAPWESVRVGHGATSCVPRACTGAAECGGGRCETRRVCLVQEQVWVAAPGPCRDLDRDGQCDRRREIREREAGACPSTGGCAEGTCRTLGTCHAP